MFSVLDDREAIVAVWNEVIRRLHGLMLCSDDGEAVQFGLVASAVADAAAPLRGRRCR